MPKERLFSRLKSFSVLWLFAAILAGIIVCAVYVFSSPERTSVTAVISYNYDGVDRGFDPNGYSFDPAGEITCDDVITAAGQSLGIAFSEDDIERIRTSMRITGSVPSGAIENLTAYTTVFEDDEVSMTNESVERYYFPSQYQVALNYRQAGYSASDGKLLLGAILTAYRDYFMNYYGYNAEMEHTIQSIDYSDYDYSQAIDVLDNSLTSLRSFIARLYDLDHTRFVSSETGYSFSDLLQAIDTVRTEDFSWVKSYIDSNNMTKDRAELINYYRYRLKNEERSLTALQERLVTLNGLIESYVKTQAIILGIGRDSANYAATSQDESSYSFTQDAYMYDYLINARVSCQTSITATEQTISLYETRINRLSAATSQGSPAIVESSLQQVDDMIKRLVAETKQTATEFFQIRLGSYYQVIGDVSSGIGPVAVIRNNLVVLALVEALIFGIFVLCSVISVLRDGPGSAVRRRGRSGFRRKRSAAAKHVPVSAQERDAL